MFIVINFRNACAKSTHLNKNVLDTNKHYLVLQAFLSEVERYPETGMDRNVQVFLSEKRLYYGKDKKVNHRLYPAYKPIEKVINPRRMRERGLQ